MKSLLFPFLPLPPSSPIPFYLCASISLYILISDNQNRTTTAFFQYHFSDEASPVCSISFYKFVPCRISYIEVCSASVVYIMIYYGTTTTILTEHIWTDFTDMRFASYFNDATVRDNPFVIGDNCIKRIANN